MTRNVGGGNVNQTILLSHFRRLRGIAKSDHYLVMPVCPSIPRRLYVCPSARKNSAPTERIIMKFYKF